MDKGWRPQPFTTYKWTRVGGPPTLHDLQMDKGLGPPPTLHDLQMDKGLGHRPPTLHHLQMHKGLAPPQPFTTCKCPPPNPFRLANGQGFRPLQRLLGAPPPPLHDLHKASRFANGQGFSPPPPHLHDVTRVAGPPTLHDLGAALQMDKGWGPPQPYPSRLANGQELGALQPFTTWKRPPNGQGLGPTSKWTRVGGPPNPDLQMDKGWPSRLPPSTLQDLQMDKGWGPQPFTTYKWTRVGGPPTLHDLQMDNGDREPLHRSNYHSQGPSAQIVLSPAQTLNFAWTRIRGQRSTNQ